MKDKIFGVLQRIGRSFMLPIAVLPVAGLLLGIGSSFTNETTIATYRLGTILGEGTILHGLLVIMSKAGSAIFDNLPIIFAIGVAIGMAKAEKEVAALSAAIAFFDECINQCSTGGHGENTSGRKHLPGCTGRYYCQRVRNTDTSNGCVWGDYRGSGGSGPS